MYTAPRCVAAREQIAVLLVAARHGRRSRAAASRSDLHIANESVAASWIEVYCYLGMQR